MNGRRLVAIAMLVALALTVGWLPPNAGAQGQARATRIEISSGPARDDKGHEIAGAYAITVTLTTADGQYVANRKVQIVETVSFFGRRSKQLGTAVTDDTGFAQVLYQPADAGQHQIVARFAGDPQYAASNAPVTVDATTVVPPFTRQPLPLQAVGRWLALSLIVIGVVFWTVLLGVVGRTLWRIRTATGQEAAATATADADLEGVAYANEPL